MSHAELCPVCKGTGTKATGEVCNGCGGKGWVEVGSDPPKYVPPEFPYVPYQPPYPVYPSPWNPLPTWDYPYQPTFPGYPIVTCKSGRTTCGF